jgi:hypothetical protein
MQSYEIVVFEQRDGLGRVRLLEGRMDLTGAP